MKTKLLVSFLARKALTKKTGVVHNNIKTTQIYARVIDSKVSEDMRQLINKFQ